MKLSYTSDEMLVKRALQENRSALEELINRHHHKLLFYIRSLGLAPCDADDVAQNVWLNVIRKLPAFRFQSSFFSWICTIARRRLIDSWRRHSTRSLRLISEADLKKVISPEPSEDDIIRQEHLEHLERSLLSLQFPDYLATTLALRRDGCEITEIAQRMNIPAGTVKSRLSRIRFLVRAAS